MISEDLAEGLAVFEHDISHAMTTVEVQVCAMRLTEYIRIFLSQVKDLEVHADRLSYRLNEAVRAIDEIAPKPVYTAQKFRRPKGDFLRVFQGGAIKE